MGRLTAVALAFIGLNMLIACNPEPDESDMYTVTDETADDYINRKPQLTSFKYILERARLDRNLMSYGEYTCFAPTNDAIAIYIDSLYKDEKAKVPHNSMTENSLEGLSDSLCSDIALYHLTNGVHTTIEMGAGVSVRSMLGRTFTAQSNIDAIGRITLEKEAVILEPDSVVTNGVVHIISKVIPRSNHVMFEELERHKNQFGIFLEALDLTGLAKNMEAIRKPASYSLEGKHRQDTDGSDLYYPKECKILYTIFAEPDEVIKAALRKEGFSEDINGLIAYANKYYKDAADPNKGWYDYMIEKGQTVSTGSDYTERNNALNMFVAYHILYVGMPEDQIVFESKGGRAVNMWNYVNGGQPYDYYETMLPHTLMKIWQPKPLTTAKELFINRYIRNNTLTNELATMGTDDMHEVIREGVKIYRSNDQSYETNIQAYNGYIHAIGDMLLYDEMVPKGVLHERMRFDATTILPEFINNGIRMATQAEISALNGGGSGARVAFPLDFFDGVKSYTEENEFRYNVKGAFRAYQADAFQGWGKYDLAVRLLPIPSGTYEFRLFYSPMGHGGMMQFYYGTSSNMQSMMALDIPLDVRIQEDDPRIGWTVFYEENDKGIGTDVAMRNRGYMRGPFSFMGHPDSNSGNDTDQNCRGDGVVTLRKILGTVTVRQSEEFWFRYKSVITDETDLKWQLDFVEFVPLNIVNNDEYSEDWF